MSSFGHIGIKVPEEPPRGVVCKVSGNVAQKQMRIWVPILSTEVVRGVEMERSGEIPQEETRRRREEACGQIPKVS